MPPRLRLGHLAQRSGAVRHEHERHLAEHDVEGLLVERERARVALAPVEVGPDAAGNRQHGLVQVETGDGTGGGDEVGSGPGDDAGAAPDVEHGLAGGDGCRVHRIGAHWAKKAGTNSAS